METYTHFTKLVHSNEFRNFRSQSQICITVLCGWIHKTAMVDFEIFLAVADCYLEAACTTAGTGTSVFHNDDVMFPSNDGIPKSPIFQQSWKKSVPSPSHFE